MIKASFTNANVGFLAKCCSFIRQSRLQMQQLNFPQYSFRLGQHLGHTTIFDPQRKRFVALTPEEWVRQHLIRYLVDEKNVPPTLLASERGLKINGMHKRFDLLAFSTDGKPLLIVECKAPEVKLCEETFHQPVRYNLALKAHYLLISNGLDHHMARVDYLTSQLQFLQTIPDFGEMNLNAITK